MRVAYVCTDPGVGVFGRKGASVHVQEVVRALRRRSEVVELFAARVGGCPPPDLADLVVHDLGRPRDRDPARRERLLMAANGTLRSRLHAAGPFDLVYERYALWGHTGMAYARTAGIPGVLEVNAPLIDEQAAHRDLADRAAAEQVARTVLGAATVRVAVSAGVARWVRRRVPATQTVHVVPNGVDPGRFAARGPAASSSAVTVGFVGTLKPWHGTDVLLEAFRRIAGAADGHDLRLLVVGDGPLRQALADTAAAAGIADQVAFTGSADPAEVPALLAATDIAVAPYPARQDDYFSPLKVYEYLAAGVPVVASRVGQVPEVIRDGVTGLLVEPGDPASLAEAIATLRHDPGLRTRLGRAGRAHVMRHHTWDRVVDRILALTASAAPALSAQGVA
jgi:glycosyltransferase involved in cell wall biosynthesis